MVVFNEDLDATLNYGVRFGLGILEAWRFGKKIFIIRRKGRRVEK